MKTIPNTQKLSARKIIKELEKQKTKLRQMGVKKIGLFGSHLHGKTPKKSDSDFIISFQKRHFNEYMELKFFLEKTFHKKVDLVLDEDLKPGLQYIRREALYAKGL